jgi:hypothetical protein
VKRIILILLIICTYLHISIGQTSIYNFLAVDPSARAAAMGGSFVSMKDDPNVLFYNPASLGTLSMPRLSVSYIKYFMDVNAGSLSYGTTLEGIGTIGVGLLYMNYGSFDRTDEALNVLGTFGAKEIAAIAGIATQYDENILVGANVKYIYSSLAEFTSTALALDAGFLIEIPSQNLSIGGSVLNIGGQLTSYASTSENLPLDVTIGITKRPQHLPVLLNLVFHRLNERTDTFVERFNAFTAGAEFLMSEAVRIRAGYNNKQRKDLKMGTSAGLAGISLGGGIVLKNYQIDYAFNSFGKIGGLHRFSIGINLQ